MGCPIDRWTTATTTTLTKNTAFCCFLRIFHNINRLDSITNVGQPTWQPSVDVDGFIVRMAHIAHANYSKKYLTINQRDTTFAAVGNSVAQPRFNSVWSIWFWPMSIPNMLSADANDGRIWNDLFGGWQTHTWTTLTHSNRRFIHVFFWLLLVSAVPRSFRGAIGQLECDGGTSNNTINDRIVGVAKTQ